MVQALKRTGETISPQNFEGRNLRPINFNRKILSHSTLSALRDTVASQGMLTGTAVEGVIDDLEKLRYLCEEINIAFSRGDIPKTLEAVELLRLIL